jgi:osmoprotectant transport system permease protein
MVLLNDLFSFYANNSDKLLEQTLEHIGLTFLSLMLAVLISVPAGILATRRPRLAPPLLGFAGVMQTIPSIALLGFMLPLLGIGFKPAIVALLLYALLPILRNTYTGITEVDPAVREAAEGMGMTDWQVLTRVELPLALPVIFAGIRTSTVINVGIATLAAYIGAGGLGEFIFGGIALNNNVMILAGAVPAALLAITFDQLLGLLQRRRIRTLTRVSGLVGIAVPLLALLPYLINMGGDRLRAGMNPEFIGREDGYYRFAEVYGMEFNTVFLSSALMYKALREQFVDVIFGYSTDGRIAAYDLVLLKDDKNAFPPYYCAPIIRRAVSEQHPEVVEALNLLAGRIDNDKMSSLNYQVDFEKRSPEDVAEGFLKELGLWKPDRQQGGKELVIASKIFTEQYILAALFAALINGYTDFDTEVKDGLGGTKICFDALRQGEVDLYPEYTGTGLLVMLSPDQKTRERLFSDEAATYGYVSDAFQTRYNIQWLEPLGFNNTYALMMRAADARQRGVVRISDLH